MTLICLSFITEIRNGGTSEITYDKFIEMVEKDQIKEVTLQSGVLTVEPKLHDSFEKKQYHVNQMENIDALTARLEGKGIIFQYEQPDAMLEILSMLLSVLLPTVLMFGMLMFFMRRMNKGGGVMGVGKSRAKAYIQQETGITFKDVAGQDEAKESLQEVVDFLHNPGKYTAIGAKLPKGALLVGPPGTGKSSSGKGCSGRGEGAVLFSFRFGICGDVCRCRCVSCPRSFLRKLRKMLPALYLLMKLMPLEKAAIPIMEEGMMSASRL